MVFWTLTLAYFLSYFFRSANAVIASDLTAALRLSDADLGLMTAAFYLGFAGSQLPIGWALDRYGVRVVQTVLLGVAVVGALTFSVADSLFTAALARALLGVGLAGCLMAAFKAFAQWFSPERQATVTGALMALGVLGAMGAASPLAWLSGVAGWRTVFVYGAVFTVVSALLIFAFVRDQPRDQPQQPLESTPFKPLEPRLLLIAVTNFFAAGALLSIQTLWGGKFLFDQYGLEKPAVGALLTVLNLGVFVGYAGIGWLADRYGVVRVARVGLGLFAVCLFGLAVRVPPEFLPTVYFAFGACGTINLLLLFHAKRLYPAALTGRATTLVNTFGIFGTFLLQTGMGVVVDALPTQGYALGFAGMALGLVVTGALYARGQGEPSLEAQEAR